MRILLVAVAAALAATFAATLPAGAGPPAVGSAQYVVEPDPRLCPSPLCGGYWVALANRSRTRCADGTLRSRCYVARAVDKERHPLPAGIPAGALVRAAIEKWRFDGVGQLGVLVVGTVRTPVGRATSAPLYRVRDTGIRCVRAPCYFMRAWRLSTRYVVTVSELKLDLARLTPDQQERAETALESPNGLFLAGGIERASDGGRLLAASRVYLSP